MIRISLIAAMLYCLAAFAHAGDAAPDAPGTDWAAVRGCLVD